MKKIIVLLTVIGMMAVFTTTVTAQSTTDTKSNAAKAEVLSAIALTAVNPLEFGGFTPGTGGTVVVTSAGVRSKTDFVTLVTGTVTFTPASYTVTGTGLATYAITIPTASFNVVNTTDVVPHATMAVTAMECSYALLHSAFLAGGTDAFTVGGTLTVASGQVAGIYAGTFNVTVAY